MKAKAIGKLYQDIQADRADITLDRLRKAIVTGGEVIKDRNVLTEAVKLLAPHVPGAELTENFPGERAAEIEKLKRNAKRATKTRQLSKQRKKGI